MVGTAAINIEKGVAGRFAKSNTEKLMTLLNEAIAEGIAVLSAPIGTLLRGMVGVQKVIAMGEQGQKAAAFADIGASGGTVDTPVSCTALK